MPESGVGIHVSVVVPAYRECRRIRRCIERLTAWLDAQPWSYELLVVDDGSDDGTTALVAESAAGDPRVRLSAYSPNRGKGYAVRYGLAQARGRYVLFTDADLATPPDAVGGALALLSDSEVDVVVGTRARSESELVVRQRWYREGMGRIFNVLIRVFGLTAMPDTQCGFKAFRAAVLPELLDGLRVDGFAFDVELLNRAQSLGLRLVEQPIRWTNDPQSKVRILRDSLRMFADIVVIAVRARRRPAKARWGGRSAPR